MPRRIGARRQRPRANQRAAFEKQSKLASRKRERNGRRLAPQAGKAALLEPLVKQTQAGAVEEKHLGASAIAADKDKQLAR